MAERGIYRNTRGPSLLGVPTLQGSREGVQLLAQTGNAAGSLGNQIQRQQRTHEDSLRDKLATDTVRRARMTFNALAIEHPADPDSFNKKAANYSQGVIQGLRGQFPDIADDLETRLPLMQSEAGAPVTATFHNINRSGFRANADLVEADALGRVESAGPENLDALMQATGDYAKSLAAVNSDGLLAFTPEEITSKMLNFREAVGLSFAHSRINAETDPEKLRSMAEDARSKSFIVNAPFIEPETGNFTVRPQNIRELLGPTGAEALANYAEARAHDVETVDTAQDYATRKAAYDADNYFKGVADSKELTANDYTQWKDAVTAVSDTPDELAKRHSEIDDLWKKQSVYRSGYASMVETEALVLDKRAGTGTTARDAFKKSLEDAQSKPVQYVRNVLSNLTGPIAQGVNASYDKMLLALAGGDTATAGAAYKTFSNAAKTQLAMKGFGYDTPLLDADAQAIASRINNIQVAEGVSPSRERAAALRGLQAVFREDTPKVMRQLFAKGIDQNVLAVSQMDVEGASVDLTNALDARGEVNKQLGEAAGVDIRESVRKNKTVSDFVASFPSNGVDFNMALAWQDNVTALAGWYVAQGKSKDEAVNLAVDGIIGKNYHMAGSLRIPRANVESEADIAQLTKAGTPLFASTLAESVKDKVAFPTGKEVMSGYVTPDVALDEYKRRLSRGARMTTNADGSGALLVDAQGAPVYVQGAKGYELVQFTWAELVAQVKPILDKAGAAELRRNTLWPAVVPQTPESSKKFRADVKDALTMEVDPNSPLGKLLWGGDNRVIGAPRNR